MAAGSRSRSDDFDEFRGDDCLDDEELIELSPGVKGKAVKRLRDNVVLYHVVSGNRGRPKKVFIFPPRPKTALQAEERRTIVRVFSNLNKLGEEDALKKTVSENISERRVQPLSNSPRVEAIEFSSLLQNIVHGNR